MPSTKLQRIERDIQVAKDVRRKIRGRGESTDEINREIRTLKALATTLNEENANANR